MLEQPLLYSYHNNWSTHHKSLKNSVWVSCQHSHGCPMDVSKIGVVSSNILPFQFRLLFHSSCLPFLLAKGPWGSLSCFLFLFSFSLSFFFFFLLLLSLSLFLSPFLFLIFLFLFLLFLFFFFLIHMVSPSLHYLWWKEDLRFYFQNNYIVSFKGVETDKEICIGSW